LAALCHALLRAQHGSKRRRPLRGQRGVGRQRGVEHTRLGRLQQRGNIYRSTSGEFHIEVQS
jgi:hypothetical protein